MEKNLRKKLIKIVETYHDSDEMPDFVNDIIMLLLLEEQGLI